MVYKDKEKQRLWKEKNRDNIKKWNREYREKNRKKINKQKVDYYHANKDKYADKHKAYQKVRYKRLRLFALQKYSIGGIQCSCCGEKEIRFLCIDHVNGGGTKHRESIGRSNTYMWLKKNNYPKGFQVLCANCNMAKRENGICPHKIK
jgi:hypothetical protein